MIKQPPFEVGSGITKRTRSGDRLEASDPSDVARIVEWFNESEKRRNRPWGDHADVIRAVLADHSRFRQPLANLVPGTPEFNAALSTLTAQVKERDTEAWYLVEIAQLTTIVELALGAGRVWEAVSRAMQIGELITELRT